MRRARLARTIAFWAAALALVPAAAFAQGPAEAVQAAAAREAALVTFYGGGAPLAPAERVRLDAAVRQAFAETPAEARSAAQDAAGVLDILKRQQGANVALARALGRRQIAFGGLHALGPGGEGAAAASLVDAHDPVVASDPARKIVVTTAAVRAMAAAGRDGARLFGVPEDGDEAALAAAIRRDWAGTDAGLRQALADAEQDLPYAAGYLDASPPAKRQAFIAEYRRKIMAGGDAGERQFRLAEVMAFTGQAGFRNRGSGGGAASMAGARQMQAARDAAGRAMLPGCGVAAGATQSAQAQSFCHPAP